MWVDRYLCVSVPACCWVNELPSVETSIFGPHRWFKRTRCPACKSTFGMKPRVERNTMRCPTIEVHGVKGRKYGRGLVPRSSEHGLLKKMRICLKLVLLVYSIREHNSAIRLNNQSPRIRRRVAKHDFLSHIVVWAVCHRTD